MKQTVRHLQAQRELVEARKLESYRAAITVDEETWGAETLNAPVEKPLEYNRGADGELYSQNGVCLADVFANAVENSRKRAEADPLFAFEYRRDRFLFKEYEMMRAGMSFIVVSPYPRHAQPEAARAIGYQPDRQLGFIRVVTAGSNGSVHMWTHSIDKSDPAGIEAMYALLGASVDWGRDVLEQPIVLGDDFDDTLSADLHEKLLATYDDTLQTNYGGVWRAGRRLNHGSIEREAIAFVQSQPDLLTAHVEQLLRVGTKGPAADKARFTYAALLKKRFEARTSSGASHHNDKPDIGAEMEVAAAEAAARGESFSGCGLSVSITTEMSAEDMAASELLRAGYLNQASVLHEKEFMSELCPECGATNIKTWIKGDLIGSDDCGSIVELCTGRVIRKGRGPQKEPETRPSDIPPLSLPVAEQAPAVPQRLKIAGTIVERQSRVGIGDAGYVWVDYVTGEQIEDVAA